MTWWVDVCVLVVEHSSCLEERQTKMRIDLIILDQLGFDLAPLKFRSRKSRGSKIEGEVKCRKGVDGPSSASRSISCFRLLQATRLSCLSSSVDIF